MTIEARFGLKLHANRPVEGQTEKRALVTISVPLPGCWAVILVAGPRATLLGATDWVGEAIDLADAWWALRQRPGRELPAGASLVIAAIVSGTADTSRWHARRDESGWAGATNLV